MKMKLRERSLFLVWVVSIMIVKTIQKQLGTNLELDEGPSDWSQMKWNSILEHSNSGQFNEENHNLHVLNFPEKEHLNEGTKSVLKLSESEIKDFSEDEVFIKEKDIQKHPVGEAFNEAVSEKLNPENLLHFNPTVGETTAVEFSAKTEKTSEEFNIQDTNKNKESKPQIEPSASNLKLDNSLMLTNQLTDLDPSNPRSFIFNPNAKPEEQFQNCTTPKNESGSCRYLQHCLIPSIVGSFTQFMDYVCIIEERFIGVCCPKLPASVVVVQDLKDEINSEVGLKEECGVSTNTRIVGGLKADPKAWPWLVALLSKSGRFFCGGSLINDRYVLTAAHCTFDVSNNEIIARLGEYDFKNDGELHEDYTVVEIKRHGHYNRRTLKNDIALLKLEKPVVFNEFIKTICFPEEEKSYVGENATLAGWGNIAGGGSTSDVLQQASFPVISTEECSKGHGIPISPSLICTGSKSGDKGACNGDSGGPLMLLDKNSRWKVIGLVSWGRRGCNPEFPTVYTRVSHHLEWIKKHSS